MPAFALTGALVCLFPAPALPQATASQGDAPIPLSAERHHHLALHNDFVNVYEVQVSPHDSVRFHQHESDAISIMLSDATVTVHSPGKPDAQSKVVNGQIRLQRAGYAHSTVVDSDAVYRNVTIELLKPQTGARNLCAQVIPGQPLDCPAQISSSDVPAPDAKPEFATDQTEIYRLQVAPQRDVNLGMNGRLLLIVALDPGLTQSPGTELAHTLRLGGFVWSPDPGARDYLRNTGAQAVRVVVFAFKTMADM